MKKLLLILLLVSSSLLMAQPWLKNMPMTKTSAEWTLYDYQTAFDQYWEPYQVNNKGYYFEDGKEIKAPGWKQFHRWYYQMEAKVDPSTGDFPSKSAQQVYDEFIKANPEQGFSKSANWTNLGPSSSTGGYAGVGRLNCIAFHPTDNNTYWVGAPAGGLWKTTNNGSSWTCLTDENNVLGVSDIIIPSDYSSSQTIYIATGDRDAWDNRSIGVLKSTNGGSTWNTTGIQYNLSDYKMVTRLLLHPNDNQTIIAATNGGVYKSTNGGSTWNDQLTSTSFIDMEYKPGDFNTLYGSTTNGSIYRSNNGGNNWSEVLSQGNRIELAVSADEPSYVYAIIANSSSALDGIYKSTNSGSSFSEIFSGNSSNLLGWESNGGGTQGQGWYDLAIAVSPDDANILLVGGINTWRSSNGGAGWSIVNHWYGGGGVQAVHADKHMLKYRDNGDLFECNDGGVYLSTNNGTSWADKTNGMIISQMYKLGVSQTNATETITGLQDNGSKLFFSNSWDDVKGGDGMECLIDYTTSNIQYATYVNGQITRTTNHWASDTDIEPSAAGEGAWVTPYIIDPDNHNTLYAGYADVWKTTNKGDSWNKISTMNTSSKIRAMAIAPSDNEVLYVSDPNEIWKTTNGGDTWSDITSNLPLSGSSITYIAVKADSPNTVWVSLSGYNSNLVFESTNGGSSWTNISDGLPSVPSYTIVQNTQAVSTIHLYLGTELGVYFKDGNNDWEEYNTNLPKVQCGELEIYYAGNPANSKLRLASYGRGLWESPLVIENTDLPSVQTTTPTNITQTTATLGGNVTNQGTSNISERGVVYSTSSNPTTNDIKIVNANTGTGSYTALVTGLASATTFYTKAYAINSYGTAYGGQESFTTDCDIFDLPFAEDFESASFPPNCWDSYRGNNGVGTTQDWESSEDAYSGSRSAHVVWEDTDGLAEDWLVSPKILISAGAEMSFYQKQEYETEYGSMYYIKVSTSSQTNISSFSNIASWGESSFSVAYSEKTIDLSAYAGQEIYIAFVMTNDNGDDWFVDDIEITGSAPIPVATISAIPDCITGTIKVMSNLSGNQTFYLTDNSGNVLDNVDADANFYNFIGLSDGTYKGKVEKDGQMSVLSAAANLTNNTVPLQPSSIAGNLMPCQETSQTYSVTNDPQVNSYNWTLPSGWNGTSNINTISVLVGITGGNISVVPVNDCGSGSARNLTVIVNELPEQPSVISGEISPCEGNSITYSVTNDAEVDSYNWTLPSGWNGTSNTNTISVLVGNTGGNISVVPVNDCGNGSARTLAAIVNELPEQPSVISGETSPCEGNSITYSVDNDPEVDSYNWTFPNGWTGTSTMSTITVTVGNAGGNIIVTPVNDCGNGTSRSLAIEVNTLPEQASVITGTINPCIGTTVIYSVINDPDADSYAWILPNDWTGTSNTNTITVTVGTEDGTISVSPVNICGNGVSRDLSVEARAIPSQANAINGNTSVCEGTQELYTVDFNGNVDNYTWSIPSGWTGTSITNEITVTIGSAGGEISIIPNNECGSGPNQTISLEVTNDGPAQPEAIEGNLIACVGTSETYSVPFDPAVDTYIWALPSGWTGSSNTNSITTSVGNSGGIISVIPSNFCGVGTAQTASVQITTSIPEQPSAISGAQEICSGETETYSVESVDGLTYTWELPSDWTGTSTSNEIEVSIGSISGDIMVTPANGCGNGTARTLAVEINELPEQPSLISGETSPCEGNTISYSVEDDPNVLSYSWIVPNGWSGNSNTHSITVTAGTTGGNLIVTPMNECGNGGSRSLAIEVNTLPEQASAITGDINPCAETSATYSVTEDPNADSYVWTLPNDWSGTSNTNTITLTVGTGDGIISVSPVNLCGNGLSRELSVEVQSIPSQTSVINGNTSVCEGTQELYTVDFDGNVDNYTWTIPSNWTGTSTTNEITVTIGSNGGDISIIPSNECGSGSSQSISLEVTNEGPAQPGAIEGSLIACIGTSETYSVPFDPAVDTYQWTLPNGWTGTSNTNSITAFVGGIGGEISVIPSNFCGVGTAQTATLEVTTSSPNQPSAITGAQEICSGETETYAVDFVNGVQYTWELPSGWTGTSITNEIEVSVGTSSGDIVVTPSNGCGNGPSSSISVIVNQTPQQASEIIGDVEVCVGATEIYSVDEQSGISYNWTLPSGWTGTSATHEISVTVGSNDGNISVVLGNECGLSPATSKALHSNAVLSELSSITGLDQIWGMDTENYSIENLDGAESYNWTLDPSWILTTGAGTHEISIDFPENANSGMLSVVAENFCGLSEASEMLIEIIPIGLPEVSIMELTIYPNPAQDRLFIESNNDLESDTEVILWTLNGSQVIIDKMKSGDQKLELDLSSLASGSYMLELKNEKYTEQHKIVVNK